MRPRANGVAWHQGQTAWQHTKASGRTGASCHHARKQERIACACLHRDAAQTTRPYHHMRAHEGMWLRLRLLHTREHGVWHTSTRQAGHKYEAGWTQVRGRLWQAGGLGRQQECRLYGVVEALCAHRLCYQGAGQVASAPLIGTVSTWVHSHFEPSSQAHFTLFAHFTHFAHCTHFEPSLPPLPRTFASGNRVSRRWCRRGLLCCTLAYTIAY